MRLVSLLAACGAALAVAAPALAAEAVTAGFHPADVASRAPAPRAAAARVREPAANFLVEWRIQPADARPAPRGDIVITSGSAAAGTSGYGPGAVVVGTARPAAPQGLRVANGKEGAIVFDRSETRTVYDMAWTASASASASRDAVSQGVTGAASSVSGGGAARSASQMNAAGVQGHEVVVHRVDGLRVTPHWVRGDTLLLDIALTHVAPAGRAASRDIDLHSTIEASFDDWLTVASVGEGGDELQVRVTWR